VAATEGSGGTRRRCAFPDPSAFDFVPRLEAVCETIRGELLALDLDDFPESPDSLSLARDGYDERGWRYLGLYGDGPGLEANRRRCPRAAAACAGVPGLVNAGFSLFRPGTHLYPHHGERGGVLRCHLPLIVPAGDLGLRAGGETRRWRPGRCLVLDDTVEHEAWNHGDGDRVVLIVTFAAQAGGAQLSRG
jgi:beta-hydroxylase